MIAAFLIGLIVGVLAVAFITSVMRDKWIKEAIIQHELDECVTVISQGVLIYRATLADLRAFNQIAGQPSMLVIRFSDRWV